MQVDHSKFAVIFFSMFDDLAMVLCFTAKFGAGHLQPPADAGYVMAERVIEKVFVTLLAEIFTRVQPAPWVAEQVFARHMQDKMAGPVADEMVDYFCLHTELVLNAESILLAREKGIDMEVGDQIKEKLVKMHALEKHIGRSGLRTLRPHLQFTAKDMWEIHLLEDEAVSPHHAPHPHHKT